MISSLKILFAKFAPLSGPFPRHNFPLAAVQCSPFSRYREGYAIKRRDVGGAASTRTGDSASVDGGCRGFGGKKEIKTGEARGIGKPKYGKGGGDRG